MNKKIMEDSNVEEQEIEQASVILGIRAVIDRLQEIGVQLSTLGAKQLMPLMSRTQLVFGDEYTKDVTETGNTAIGICIDAIQKAKNMLATETLKLEGKMSGINNDMEKETSDSNDVVNNNADDNSDNYSDEFGAVEQRSGPANEPVGREKKEESLSYFNAYKLLKENIKKGNFPIYINLDKITTKICESHNLNSNVTNKLKTKLIEWFKQDHGISPEEFTIEYELGKRDLYTDKVDPSRYSQLVNIHINDGVNKNLSLVKAAEDYYNYFGVDPRVQK